MATLEEGQRALRRLVDFLGRSTGLEDIWARGILESAQDRAAGHPSPQSRMAADSFIVQRGGIIRTLSGGPPGEVAEGSEFGSTIYRQFAPRNTRGYWLLPSANSPDAGTIASGEDWIDDQVRDAIRGF